MGRGVVVIGAGHAGVQVAVSLREGGYAGPVTIVGDERVLPYQRPSVSKEMLARHADPAEFALRPPTFFTEERISLVTGRAVGIDRADKLVQIAGGRRLGYDHLVLATGAAPRPLAMPGRSLVGVRQLRSAADALSLGRSLDSARQVVVLGGGFIGLEVASAATARGLPVTVIERGDRLLERVVSPPVSTAVAAHHRATGVRLLLGEPAARIEGREGRVAWVRTASGRLLDADLVVVGLGAAPQADLARQAGLVTRGGVVVDHRLATSDPSISAIGDCAVVQDPMTGEVRHLTSVQNAGDQAGYLARRLLGRAHHEPYEALPWFWSNQGTLKLQMVGLASGPGELVVRGEGGRFSVFRMQEGILTAVESLNDPGTHMAARRLMARTRPTAAELLDADFDVRALARRAMAAETAGTGAA